MSVVAGLSVRQRTGTWSVGYRTVGLRSSLYHESLSIGSGFRARTTPKQLSTQDSAWPLKLTHLDTIKL